MNMNQFIIILVTIFVFGSSVTKGCSPEELKIYIDDLAPISANPNQVLVTMNTGTCYLFYTSDEIQTKVSCSDYTDQTGSFTTSDTD